MPGQSVIELRRRSNSGIEHLPGFFDVENMDHAAACSRARMIMQVAVACA